jgi:hypothetical protein
MLIKVYKLIFSLLIGFLIKPATAQTVVNIDKGWAKNSVNTVIFRKNALTSFKNYQFASFYDGEGNVIIARRKIKSDNWIIKKTPFKGNAADAHRSISITIDGEGYLHISWDHHNTRLRYAKSLKPLGLNFGQEEPMTGINENRVSYPEFYKLPDGNLLFFYRDGGSGNGSLVINNYNVKTKKWIQVQKNLIDGEGKRNAYWQSCVDEKGMVHISWVWRETPDVASNHDICYARSKDGGVTWERSDGKKYSLPITESNAEYAVKIPPNSELINQTSMTVISRGNILIATYWRDKGEAVPQFHVVLKTDNEWLVQNLGFRKSAFSLSGVGTKRIPISRPQIIAWKERNDFACGVIFRDEERDNFISIAINKNINKNKWNVEDILKESCDSYEPLFDCELWNNKKQLQLFVQKTDQVDNEGKSTMMPQIVKVVKWDKK